uniref:Uncharacterized protein n=1 Tax=Acrobeloides nanus TaxID=290746 RepID=A0A914EFW9_9BILA
MFLIGPVYSVDVKVTLQFKHESLIESCSTGCCYLSLVFLHIIAVAFKTWHRSNFRPVYFPMKVNRKLIVGSVEARMKTVGGRQIIREECFKKNHPHPKLFHSTYQLLENIKKIKKAFSFVHYERITGQCHGFEALSRHHCSDKGGKWIPGFDISGHCFLLIYSVLIVCEEAIAFKNWPTSPKNTPKHITTPKEYEDFQVASRLVQYLFIAKTVFHFLWDVQLVITSLYYHTLSINSWVL